MQRLLLLLGALAILAGLLWPWLERLPFGRLPGDVRIVRENVSFFFPITTGIVVSLVVTAVLWFLRR